MLTLRIKPEKILTTSTGEKYNDGGRPLRPEESPTGKAIKPGSTFEAPEDWYEARRHWHFLTLVDKTEERHQEPHTAPDPREPEPPSNDQFLTEKEALALPRAAWDEFSWNDFRSKASDLGVETGGSRDAIMKRLIDAGLVEGGD